MDAEIEGVEVGGAYFSEEVHFSGGLRGLQVEQGWALVPIPSPSEPSALVFSTAEEHARFARKCGVRYLGSCIRYRSAGSHAPMDVWEPGARERKNGLNAADSWNAVAFRAREAGDIEYADCATYISICLKTAGLRLRDVSNGYHDQLQWALLERRKVGTWFSNAALLDLYADFHSLVSELSSARDHLARLAAIHAGADKKVDSLARLDAWARKQTNASSMQQSLAAILLFELGKEPNHGWLHRLGEVRNEMLHRVPMGRNRSASGLTMLQVETRNGPVCTIRLAQPLSETPLEKQGVDPLVELSEISMKFEQMCRAAWKLARYPARVPEFGLTPS